MFSAGRLAKPRRVLPRQADSCTRGAGQIALRSALALCTAIVTQVVDFWHLVEKLAAASSLLDGDAAHRLARWRLRLLNVENAAWDIRRELLASGQEDKRVGDTRPVHEAITYIKSHHTRMN